MPSLDSYKCMSSKAEIDVLHPVTFACSSMRPVLCCDMRATVSYFHIRGFNRLLRMRLDTVL